MQRKFPRTGLVSGVAAAVFVSFGTASLISEAGTDNHAADAASARSDVAAAAGITAERNDRATEASRSVESREPVPHTLAQALNTQRAQSSAVAEQKAQQRAAAEEAARQAAEEAARKKAAEEAARKKAAEEEAARQKAAEEAARKKAAEEEAAARQAAAEAAARKKAEEEARAANAWGAPLSDYRITAGFGASGSRWSSNHTGLDFAAPTGTKVRAVARGTVSFAGWDGAYGNKIEIRHADGTVTWYAHLSEFAVSVGSKVSVGEAIGRVGSTGNSTGPHLHLEVHPGGGAAVDPRRWLADHGVNV